MTEELDWIARSGKHAKGRRPDYLADPSEDRLVSIVMAVVAELSVLRERLDTVERLLEAKGSISRADIEAYAPDANAGYERSLAVREYLARILRGLQQATESLEADEPLVEEVLETVRRM